MIKAIEFRTTVFFFRCRHG